MHTYFVNISLKSSIKRDFKENKTGVVTFTDLYEQAAIKNDAFMQNLCLKTNDTSYEVTYTENLDETVKSGDSIYVVIHVELKLRARNAASFIINVLDAVKNASSVLHEPEILRFNISRYTKKDIHVQVIL